MSAQGRQHNDPPYTELLAFTIGQIQEIVSRHVPEVASASFGAGMEIGAELSIVLDDFARNAERMRPPQRAR